ncbi:Acetokinase family-domain-containing protein [Mycena alexandri]|uniref:Probable acetate kinase n=1 Tax=Mycena alexandri TaxID=1745969 RepID=A0AAD6T749_9AGAR|nr:Acetokinase family-domain-containing protein [Mycena alexandri]
MSPEDNLVLSVNAGSSSLKISLYSVRPGGDHLEPVELKLTSSMSNISAPPAKFSFKVVQGTTKDEKVESIHDHASAFAHFIDCLDEEADLDRARITHVCHRVVHGGDYTDPVVVNDEAYKHIETLSDLAPLHNGASLAVIKTCLSQLSNAKSIAFFDTAFHRSIPPHISSYAIDQKIAKKRGLKKYGFHGLSYSFILRSVSRFLEKVVQYILPLSLLILSQPANTLNLIILHLGSGASACCIQHGQSLDTSMGLTPLNGLPGATRSGTIDPSLIFHYTNKAGRMSHDKGSAVDLHVTQAEHILNTQAGWKALAGTTDFGEITARAQKGGRWTPMRGWQLRAFIGERVECLGYARVDEQRNGAVDTTEGIVVDIGVSGGSQTKRVLVCRTDEQLEMARQCIPGVHVGRLRE